MSGHMTHNVWSHDPVLRSHGRHDPVRQLSGSKSNMDINRDHTVSGEAMLDRITASSKETNHLAIHYIRCVENGRE